MKKVFSTMAVMAFLLGTISLTADAAAKSMTWTGWVSDSACGVKGANAEHADCGKKCVHDKGASYVFVDGATNNVVKIHNQTAVHDTDFGHQVTVTGHLMADGSVHIDKVSEVKAMDHQM
jgi:hypothetical protein